MKNLRYVKTYENYRYDGEENRLFFARSKKRVMPMGNGNFLLKKRGEKHELTVEELLSLTSNYCKIDGNLPPTKEEKAERKRIIRMHVLHELKKGTSIVKIKKLLKVSDFTVYKYKKELDDVN